MIEAKEITKFYGKGESRFQVLKNISIKINDGDFTVILGASGSGKSTLLNTLSAFRWRGLLRKIQRSCFWTNPRARLTRKRAGKSSITYALCKTSTALLLLW